MKIYDISMSVHSKMNVYKERDEKRPELSVISDFDTGSVYETEIKMNLHTGTHIDAPLHVFKDGETTDNFDIKDILRPCRVLDLTYVTDQVSAADFNDYDIKSEQFLLLKTKNSNESYLKDFPEEFIYLAEDGAEFLADKGIKGVGIDSLGIERNQLGHPTHKVLLSHGVTIVEGLNLKGIKEGNYTLLLAPLKISEAESAPARAVLITDYF
ncbi:cyclase family protein [Selenihalanaerobacter shriftii]|uniref:Kynurenine formamidase n=1 Tax=Selenihalanaerobacter shriftii TaxID=142842 RepID=A0A1T4KDK8_9FIRM|nr:cyclase family protein [Selenihalanaerobacter shriftii]SJZ40435.1 Kynurenine formamidase [Selenihalanaerobacter shriftii]